MNGGFAVNVLLGLSIIGLIVLIVYLVKKYYKTLEGFFQVSSTAMVDIDEYMKSVSAPVIQVGVEQERDRLKCPEGYQLRAGNCYLPCGPGFIGVADKCVSSRVVGQTLRTGDVMPRCATGYEFDNAGPRDPECTAEGRDASGNPTPVCEGCTTTAGVTTCVKQQSQPTCFKICDDKERGVGSKCIQPLAIDQPVAAATITDYCQGALKTRFIRIDGGALALSLVVAIDENGDDVARGKPVTASGCRRSCEQSGDYDGPKSNGIDHDWIYFYNETNTCKRRKGRYRDMGFLGRSNEDQWYADEDAGFNTNWNDCRVRPVNRAPNDLTLAWNWAWDKAFISDWVGWWGNWDQNAFWEVDLGKEYTLQSVTVFSTTGENQRWLHRRNLKLLDAQRRTNYMMRLSSQAFHNFRFYFNPGTQKVQASEINMPDTRNISSYLNGSTLVSHILIHGKNDFLHLDFTNTRDGIEVFQSVNPGDTTTVDGATITATDRAAGFKRITIRRDWIMATPVGYGGIISDNLRQYHSDRSSAQGRINFYGDMPTPFILINFPRQIQIERVVINNRRDSGCGFPCNNRLDGFAMQFYGENRSMVWCTSLSDEIRQEYQINQRLQIESGVCTSRCLNGFAPVTSAETQGLATELQCVRAEDQSQTYRKGFQTRMQEFTCKQQVKYDNIRVNKLSADERTIVMDDALRAKCATTPARRGREYYDPNYDPNYPNKTLPQITSDIQYLIDQDVFSYCDLRANETLELYREVIPRPSGGCPSGYVERSLTDAEVFNVVTDEIPAAQAPGVCAAYGARVATTDELTDAFLNGAGWCRWGWINRNGRVEAVQLLNRDSRICPGFPVGVVTGGAVSTIRGVNCFGIKPKPGTPNVANFDEFGETKIWYATKRPFQRPQSFQMCVRKTDTDLLLEKQKENPDYTNNIRCMRPCPEGFTINYQTRKCVPKPELATNRRAPTLPEEVFYLTSEAQYTKQEADGVCAKYSARVATTAELAEANRRGANWPDCGWVRDTAGGSILVSQAPTGGGTIKCCDIPARPRAGVTCYGVRPRRIDENKVSETDMIVSFASPKESMYENFTCPSSAPTYLAEFGKCYANCPAGQTAVGKYCFPAGTAIKSAGFPVVPQYIPLSCPAGTELRSDGLCYPTCEPGFTGVPGRCLPPVVDTNQYGGNSKITVPDVEELSKTIFNISTYIRHTGVKGFAPPTEAAKPIVREAGGNFTPPFPAPTAAPEKKDSQNYALFETMAARDSSSPVNLMYDWFEKPLAATTDVADVTQSIPNYGAKEFSVEAIVYGPVKTADAPVKQEIDDSLALARRVYLGSPNDVDKFLMVAWDDQKPYIRGGGVTDFFYPEAVQVFDRVGGLNQFRIIEHPNRGRNVGIRQELTPALFALFSGPARNFIKTWVASRTNRIIRERFGSTETGDQVLARLNAVKELALPPTITLDITKKEVLNDIAQTFYEYTRGKYIMTYIYDVYTLGTTMVDIRFDMTQHEDEDAGYGTEPNKRYGTKMKVTNRLYTGVLDASGMTQDIVDEARSNYQGTMADLQLAQAESVKDPKQGIVGRFFYATNAVTGKIMFNGFTLDRRVVTTFLRGLNCGIDAAGGTEPGNVNYSPLTRYTKNPAPSLVCKDIRTIRRIMSDYTDAVMDPESGLQHPLGDISGTLIINEITGIHQVNDMPYQCAYSWRETVFDDTTNQPSTKAEERNMQRHAIFTYNPNEEDWYANERVFDLSGFTFLSGPSVPACKWDPAGYRETVGKRLFGSNDEDALKDFRLIGMRENRSPCPKVNPGYTFSPFVYSQANDDLLKASFKGSDGQSITRTNDPNGNYLLAITRHFFEAGYNENRVLSPAFTIPAVNPPVRLHRPLPAETQLTTENNEMCEIKTCNDPDVLYGLIDDYNMDPDQPGMILRVTKATTPTENTCHIEADIDWDAQIEDPNNKGTQIRKGSAKAIQALPSGSTGVKQKVTFELLMDLDPSDCTYSLEGAEAGKGVTIQSNTPVLPKPMEYTTEARTRKVADLRELTDEVSSVAAKVLASAQQKGTAYRQATYQAVNKIDGRLASAADVTAAGKWPPPAALVGDQTVAAVAKKEGFQNAMPRPAATRTGDTAPPSIQELRALDTHAFGRDSARNMNQGFALQDMYALPLGSNGKAASRPTRRGVAPPIVPTPLTPFETAVRNQTIATQAAPLYAKPAQVGIAAAAGEDARTAAETQAAYKFLRFRPLSTRVPTAEAVAVWRFSFFYKGTELAVNQAKVTNPMGDWEGVIGDITGAGGKGFRDVYKKALVFAFPQPILVDGFSFTTAKGVRSAAEDPVTWKVEGSHNGTFWQVLHEQVSPFPVPAKRGEDLPMFRLI